MAIDQRTLQAYEDLMAIKYPAPELMVMDGATLKLYAKRDGLTDVNGDGIEDGIVYHITAAGIYPCLD